MTTSIPRVLENKKIVIKVGGSTLGKGDSTIPDIVALWKRGAKPVVVHGGGKVITDWVAKLGIQPEFIDGLSRTDKATLDVAVAVLAGLVNSQLVAEFQSAGANAVGISGVSDGLLEAEVLNPDLGYVGKIVKANPAPLETLIDAGSIPVIAPTALNLYPSNIDEDGILSGIQFEIMPWDTGQFVTPDYSIDILNLDGTLDFSLKAESISFSISSILAATDQTDFRPIKGPVPVKGVIPTRAILLSLILIGTVAGMIWTWRQRQRAQYQKIDYAVMEAPEDRALRRLKELDASGLSKEYYADLSHISREFMETKYFIRALEMTTEEIHAFRSLFPMGESQFSQWVQFLNEADMVKYAREIPSKEKMSVDKEKISSLIHQL